MLTAAGLTCIGLAAALVLTTAVGGSGPPVTPEQTDGAQPGRYQDLGQLATSGVLPASRKPAVATAGASQSSLVGSATVSPSQQATTAAAMASATAPRPEKVPSASAATLVRVAASGGCLTAQQSGLTVSACVSSPAQEWVLKDGLLRSGDLCAMVPDGRSADRTPVVMSACTGLPEQRFGLSSGSLLAVESGKCLDLFGGASGTDVVLWECNGRDNQQWSTT